MTVFLTSYKIIAFENTMIPGEVKLIVNNSEDEGEELSTSLWSLDKYIPPSLDKILYTPLAPENII